MDALAQLTTALAGRYAVDREIGRGGMAVVYLARDLRHNRHVALKVLNPELGAVLGVERFLSEIQVTANLQHPNLLPLFDSGEAGGLLFYVMPYVEGESLRKQLMRVKQLPIDEAIHIATAIASALDYAHRHGVIHRDLKPENILLQEGQPVIADFGIALAVSNAGGNRVTQTGISLGTPQYMSPEQATGDRDIDGRTDIYSLGAMLYEMLAGEPPYVGNTAQAIIAKVITDKPRSVRLSRDTVPPHVEAAVECALSKLPADRFATAHAFADALKSHGTIPSRSMPLGVSGARRATGGGTASRSRQLLVASAGVALAALGAAAGYMAATRSRQASETIRYEVRLPNNSTLTAGLGIPVAVAPGGRAVAYIATGNDNVARLYLRSAEDLAAHEVPGSDRPRYPFFSPDGEWIAFWADGQLRKASVRGGQATLLADVPAAARVTWSKSGRMVTSAGNRLSMVSSAGGAPRVVAKLDSAGGETGQLAPVALADGKHVLYTSLAMGGPAASRIGVANLDDGTSRILDIRGSFALGVLDGYLIYTTAIGTVMAVRVDDDFKPQGDPLPIIDQISVQTGTVDSYTDLSLDGTLVYVSGLTRRQIVYTSAGGASRPIVPEAGGYGVPRVSPDGKKLVVTLSTSARSDVYVYDLPSGPMNRLTTEGTTNDRPEWLPNGREVLYRSNRGGLNAIWKQPVDGSGAASLLFGLKDSKVDEGVLSPDGRYLLFQRDLAGRGEQWYRAMQGDTTMKRVGTGALGEVGGRFSPDGKWVVYTSSESGTSQIYARPFPSLGARYQVSLNGGVTPLWSPDGKKIYYVAGRELTAATIGSLQPFTIASREPVFGRGYTFNNIHADYDALKDGRTFVALKSPDQDVQLVVVHNWRAELQARVRGQAR